jgi:predicted transcriptional regulator
LIWHLQKTQKREKHGDVGLEQDSRPGRTALTRVSRTARPETTANGARALPSRRFSRIVEGMEVHFPPDVETRLQQVASANGKDAEQLVKDTVARMLENQARFIAGVQRGIEQADRGEFVEHKDLLNRIDGLFHS